MATAVKKVPLPTTTTSTTPAAAAAAAATPFAAPAHQHHQAVAVAAATAAAATTAAPQQQQQQQHTEEPPVLPAMEESSDGLSWRGSLGGAGSGGSWLLRRARSYTRSDCRCGHCPASDPEPCPFAGARPPSASEGGGGALQSVLSAGRRSLSRLLSVREGDV